MAERVILVVDDSEDYQRLLARALQPAGYRVVAAGSAEEGWAALETSTPDAAILDWNLPGASGIDLAKRIRRDPRFERLILVMLSVNTEAEDQIQGLREGGVNAYMAKPFSPQELLARLEALLQRRQRRS